MFCSLNHEVIFFCRPYTLHTQAWSKRGKIYLNPQAGGGLNKKNGVFEHMWLFVLHVMCQVQFVYHIYIFICVYYVRVFVSLSFSGFALLIW